MINGIPVDNSCLHQGLQYIVPRAEAIGASPFETSTALALYIFSMLNVDVEILEAGVGARLDATTAIPADMALITAIGLDHQAWLGNTLAEIAHEKAFAMHGCRWALTGEATQPDIVMKVLREHHQNIQQVPTQSSLHCAMMGKHQQANASLALAAIQLLEDAGKVHAQGAYQVVEATQLPGRMQKKQIGDASIWLDAAHNMHAIQAILPLLPTLADPFDAIFLFPRKDRSLDEAQPLLLPLTHKLMYQRFSLGQQQECVRNAVNDVIASNPSGKYLLLGSFRSVAAVLLDKQCV